VKIALSQINYHIGNFGGNLLKMKHAILDAREKGADLIIFAELSVSGYPPRDFLEFDDFIHKCYRGAEELARECYGIAAIIGTPVFNKTGQGKPLFNAALYLEEGEIRSSFCKSLLPNYDIFDEYRYFEPNREFQILECKGRKFAVTICEDLWNIGEEVLYVNNPMDELIKMQPEAIINIAASPFHYEQSDIRKGILCENAARYELPVFYVNHVGAQTELLFDGGSMVIDSRGQLLGELSYFVEDLKIFDLDEVLAPERATSFREYSVSKIESIHHALVMGIRNYFNKLGFEKAIVGLSGGIDSAVTLALAARALGPENLLAVMMPSAYSSLHSVHDALVLAKNLRCPYEIINIEDIYSGYNTVLHPWFKNLSFDVTEENLQARIRGVILMALSNKFNYILLNTSNKSEAAVGYGTLYGDMNGGLSVLGDVYKTDVFELAAFINREGEVIPKNTIIKPPSAELRPGQKDSDSLPEYETLDKILYLYIEKRKGPEEIIREGFEETIVRKALRLVNTNEYKRYQTPPTLRVSPKAFGMGRRMPIVARYLS